jgi:hypothetical protein
MIRDPHDPPPCRRNAGILELADIVSGEADATKLRKPTTG